MHRQTHGLPHNVPRQCTPTYPHPTSVDVTGYCQRVHCACASTAVSLLAVVASQHLAGLGLGDVQLAAPHAPAACTGTDTMPSLQFHLIPGAHLRMQLRPSALVPCHCTWAHACASCCSTPPAGTSWSTLAAAGHACILALESACM